MARKNSCVASFLGSSRQKSGLTQKEVSAKTGIPLGTIRRWEQGQNDPDLNSLIQFVELYGVSLDAILKMRVAGDNSVNCNRNSRMTSVPLLSGITATDSIETINSDETYDIPTDIYERFPQTFLFKVEDDSMNRVLPNGCYALINPCQEASKPMKAYVVCVNGFDATIKRVKPLSNGYELIPDSIDPTYRPQIFDFNEIDTQPVSIIGEVVWYLVPFGFEIQEKGKK